MLDNSTRRMGDDERNVLLQVLIYHQRLDIGSCGCGWSVLGASHAEHVADVYEDALRWEVSE